MLTAVESTSNYSPKGLLPATNHDSDLFGFKVKHLEEWVGELR